MKLHDDQEDSSEINITPLIDVVFLLLIFFMVSTTFSRHSELQIVLPESSAEKTEPPSKVIEMLIDREGKYYLDGHQLVNTSTDTIRRALLKAAGEGETPPVVISADGMTPHQAVVTAMDAARLAGLTRLTFTTTQSPESE